MVEIRHRTFTKENVDIYPGTIVTLSFYMKFDKKKSNILFVLQKFS